MNLFDVTITYKNGNAEFKNVKSNLSHEDLLTQVGETLNSDGEFICLMGLGFIINPNEVVSVEIPGADNEC